MSEIVKQLRKRFEETRREVLSDMLSNCCTREDRAKFAEIWPKGVPANKLDSAIGWCERTLKGRHGWRRA